MDQLSVLKEIYDETAQQRNSAIGALQDAQGVLNDARVQLKIAENQAATAVAADEAILAKKKVVEDLYNSSLARPQALLAKIDALTSELTDSGDRRKRAKEIVFAQTKRVSEAETHLAVAQIEVDRVSGEITQLGGEIQRIRSALN
jgi:chromosome segregation ATPase